MKSVTDAYERYERTGRARLWNDEIPGYARLVADVRTHLMASMVSSLSESGPGRVLDLGCGDGDLAGERASLGRATEWIGLDLRPAAIAQARSRFPDATFLVASADSVPLGNGSLDVVVARVLFSSLPAGQLEEAVASEIGRLLRPGGWLVWLDLRYGNPTNPAVHPIRLGRIANLFPGWKQELRSVGLLPPIARRLGPTTRFAYPALTALPPLRSHLVGRLQRPAGAT